MTPIHRFDLSGRKDRGPQPRARYLQVLLVLFLVASSTTAQTVGIGPTIVRKGTTIEILDPSVDIQTVIDGIADASASKPYLVKLAPGVYDLDGGNLLMREFVDFAGSGQGTTEIVSRLSGVCQTGAVVVLADNMELSDLKVTNDDDSSDFWKTAVCVGGGTSPRISRVTAKAVTPAILGGTQGFLLLLQDGDEPLLTDVTAVAGGAETAIGIYCSGADASFRLARGTVRVTGAQTSSWGIWLLGECSPEMRQLSVEVEDSLQAYGIVVHSTSKPRILHGIVEARQGSSSVGISVTTDASPLIANVHARAADGNVNRGIEVLGNADVTIRRSTMSGSDAGLYSDSSLTVFVTQSTLRQGTGGTGTLNCVATDDGAGSQLSASCN